MKIALGTAQFGLDYGVSNNSGQVSYHETKLILKKAKQFKICTLDTAMSYGNCEKILGDIGVSNFNLITKLPPIPNNLLKIESWITDNLNRSLNNLCVSKLYGLLLHNSGDLTGKFGKQYYQCLLNLKKKILKFILDQYFFKAYYCKILMKEVNILISGKENLNFSTIGLILLGKLS